MSLKSGRDFEADKVLRIIGPTTSSGIGHRQPLLSHQGDQDVTRTAGPMDGILEIDPWLNILEIPKYVIGSKCRAELLV
jgi:hypothetical protein